MPKPAPYRRFAAAVAAGRAGAGTPAADRAWTDVRTCLRSWGAAPPAASLLASLWLGRSVLPPRIGLRAWGFRAFVRAEAPAWPVGKPLPQPLFLGPPCRVGERAAAAEIADLERLLLSGRRAANPLGRARCTVLALGCMGYGHMWRDMGLASRAELRALLAAASPRVAARNTRDMRWKKFLYRELCKSEAGYVCRAPSCDRCIGYAECFGAET